MNTRTFIICLAGLFTNFFVLWAAVTPIIERPGSRWYHLETVPAVAPLDPALGTLLPSSAFRPWGACLHASPWTVGPAWRPSPSQVLTLEIDLAPLLAVMDRARPTPPPEDPRPPLSRYHRQYLGYRDLGGRPIVVINGFLAESATEIYDYHLPSWRRTMICVEDGGDRYWQVEYDPFARRFRSFSFNGTA